MVLAAAEGFSIASTPGKDSDDDRSTFRFFLGLDKKRITAFSNSGKSVALLDRSIHTLLAHQYAVNKLFNRNTFSDCLADSRTEAMWPDLIVYLDADQSLLEARARHRHTPVLPLFILPEYNVEFRNYFFNEGKKHQPLLIVDGGMTSERAAIFIAELVGIKNK